MDLATIENLDSASLSRLSSAAYKDAFEDPTTGKAFAARVDELDKQPAASASAGTVRRAAPAPEFSSDPSFVDEEPSAAVPAVSTVPTPAPAVEPTTEEVHIHRYQPTDAAGRKIGGEQVFRYRTLNDPNDEKSLVRQLTKAHMASSARIRELSRTAKLEEIAASGIPRTPMSTAVPTTIEELSKELIQTRQDAYNAACLAAIAQWQASVNWQRYRNHDNAATIVAAVDKASDDPRDPQSYQRAFERMKDYLVPVAQPAAVSVAPVEEVAPVVAAPAPVPARAMQPAMIATGLSSIDASSEPAIEPVSVVKKGQRFIVNGKVQILNVVDLDKMRGDDLKRLLSNRANAAAANILYEEQSREQAARRTRR
jgi:hypothetical protein